MLTEVVQRLSKQQHPTDMVVCSLFSQLLKIQSPIATSLKTKALSRNLNFELPDYHSSNIPNYTCRLFFKFTQIYTYNPEGKKKNWSLPSFTQN